MGYTSWPGIMSPIAGESSATDHPEQAASRRDAAGASEHHNDGGAADAFEEEDEELPEPPESIFAPELLPVANIARIIKATLPASSKISREAKDCINECLSEFICFLTSEAKDRSKAEKRKTITGDDLLYAMRVLGMEQYEAVCKVWLSRHRSVSLHIAHVLAFALPG